MVVHTRKPWLPSTGVGTLAVVVLRVTPKDPLKVTVSQYEREI